MNPGNAGGHYRHDRCKFMRQADVLHAAAFYKLCIRW
jgi:hypothetical protein